MSSAASHAPRAWVLNLDAEHELEVGSRYTPTRHLARLVARERRRLLGTLVGPEDIVLDEGSKEADTLARGRVGIAWSPTPRALARLASAGARLPAAPEVDVLRTVNARAFATAVRAPLAEASFEKQLAGDLAQVLALLARPAPEGWLVRRPFGAAGRGRRRLAAGRPDAAEHAWLVAGLRRGPLLVEPWVQVRREYTRCGWVGGDASVAIAPPYFQSTTAQGAWTRSDEAGASEVGAEDDRVLEEVVARAGAALAEAGYFGPFGIDAFRYLDSQGRERLNPMSEINARYTMDWSLGLRELPLQSTPGPRP